MNNVDLRSDLVKAIDQLIEAHLAAMDNLQKQLIERGEKSLLNALHNINFDETATQWCFRSGKQIEEYTINEYGFYDINGQNKEQQDDDEQNKDLLGHYLSDMMRGIRNAVNNYDNEFKSYSKSLSIPLFKYIDNFPQLIITEMSINTINLFLDAHCYNWEGKDRNFIESLHMDISFKELSSKLNLLERIHNTELSNIYDSRSGRVTIDNIEFSILNVVIDISQTGRKYYNEYYSNKNDTMFKTRASYKSDSEVLATSNYVSDNGHIVKSQNVIQLIRILFFLKIEKVFTDRVQDVVDDILKNNYPEYFKLQPNDVKSVRWVLEYLNDEKIRSNEEHKYWMVVKGRETPLYNPGSELIKYYLKQLPVKKETLTWFISMIDL